MVQNSGSFTHLLREVGSVSTMIYTGAVTIHPRLIFQVIKSSLSTMGFPSQKMNSQVISMGFYEPSRVFI